MEEKKSGRRFTEEFKVEAVRQVTERGHPVAEVAARLGVSTYSLYGWIKCYSVSPAQRVQQDGQADEIRRLKAELRRVSEERDILKKAAAYFAKQSGLSTPSSRPTRWNIAQGACVR